MDRDKPPRYPATLTGGTQAGPDDHFCRCPVCGHLVDETDLEEVMRHPPTPHEAPVKQ